MSVNHRVVKREERSLFVWRWVGVTDYLRYWSQTEVAKHRLKDSGHTRAHINDTQTERPSPVLFPVGALDPNPFYLRLCVWVYSTCKCLCMCGWAPVRLQAAAYDEDLRGSWLAACYSLSQETGSCHRLRVTDVGPYYQHRLDLEKEFFLPSNLPAAVFDLCLVISLQIHPIFSRILVIILLFIVEGLLISASRSKPCRWNTVCRRKHAKYARGRVTLAVL